MTEPTKPIKPKKPNTEGLDGIHKGGRYVRDPKTGKIEPVDPPETDDALEDAKVESKPKTTAKAKSTVSPVTKEKVDG